MLALEWCLSFCVDLNPSLKKKKKVVALVVNQFMLVVLPGIGVH